MNQIKYQCIQCKKKIKANIGQTIINSELRWYLSYKCPYCDAASEMDDIGFAPEEIRERIIAEEGEWKLIIDKSQLKNKSKLLKVLRQVFDLSIQETSKLLKNFPEITSGTKTEMQWLKQLFFYEGINSLIEKK